MDISAVSYFLPAFTWVLSFLIVFAILAKTKILGESKAINAIVGIVLALIFVSVVDVRLFVEAVTPWFVLLFVGLFFIILLASFALKKPEEIIKPWLVWVFIGVLVLVFLFKGFHIFNVSSNADFISIKDWLSDGTIVGSLWLILFAAVTVFAVARKAK